MYKKQTTQKANLILNILTCTKGMPILVKLNCFRKILFFCLQTFMAQWLRLRRIPYSGHYNLIDDVSITEPVEITFDLLI